MAVLTSASWDEVGWDGEGGFGAAMVVVVGVEGWGVFFFFFALGYYFSLLNISRFWNINGRLDLTFGQLVENKEYDR